MKTSATQAQINRYWSRVERRGPNDCWNWQGPLNDGYGSKCWQGKKDKAHRVAWQVTYGEIPGSLYVLHTCDNRACCNPSHLWLGTHLDNMDDMTAKGRRARGETFRQSLRPYNRHGERNGRSKLTAKDADDIRCLANLFSAPVVAKWYGVSHPSIYRVWYGEGWIDGKDESVTVIVEKPRRRYNSKLTPEQVEEIRELKGKLTLMQIGALYSIHYSQVSNIFRGKQWKKADA